MSAPKPWKHPDNYIGADWTGYHSAGFGQHRDSDALERSNFRVALAALEQVSDRVQVVSENHWAVGWAEWIAIPNDDVAGLARAGELCARLEDYPVLDEFDYSALEQEDADEAWRDCLNVTERILYIRQHRQQFEFRNLADMLGCVRGQYFAGYASEFNSK